MGYRRSNEPTVQRASQIVVRAISAELFRSFDKFGRMDPFAVVDWCYEDGRTVSIGRTKTAARQCLRHKDMAAEMPRCLCVYSSSLCSVSTFITHVLYIIYICVAT